MQSSEFTASIKIHNQLAIYPRPVERIVLHSCEWLKDDDIAAAQFPSIHTYTFIQWELIFTRLFCLAKKQKLAPRVRNWLYGNVAIYTFH